MNARIRAHLIASAAALFTGALAHGATTVAAAGISFAEGDPLLYASADPLSRSVLTNPPSSAPEKYGSHRPSKTKTAAEVTPDRAPEGLRDSLNDAPNDEALSPPNADPGSTDRTNEDSSQGRSSSHPKAEEQLAQISRRIRTACAAMNEKNCADRPWGDEAPQPAQEETGRPRTPGN